MDDVKPVGEGLIRSTSKYSCSISKNLAEMDSGILPEGIHRWVQDKQMNINGNFV